MLHDAHAEARQAARRVFGTQVEVVGAAGGTVWAFHVGLQDGAGDAVVPILVWGQGVAWGRGSPCTGTARWHRTARWHCPACHTGTDHQQPLALGAAGWERG